MKVTIDDSMAFADAIAWADSQRQSSGGGNAVLAGIHLAAEGRSITLQVTDYDIWATATVEATVHEPGAAILPGALISGVAKNLPRKPLDLVLDGTTVTLACGAMCLEANTVGAIEWPKALPLPQTIGKVAAKDLRGAVVRVAPGLGDPKKADPPFRSFGLTANGTLDLAATDRYRLAIARLSWEPVLDQEDIAATLLSAYLKAIAQHAPAEGDVTLHLDPLRPDTTGSRRFGLSWPGRTVMASTVVGIAPPYAKTLEIAKPVISAEVDREELLSALKRVDPAAARDEAGAALLDLTFGPGALILAVASAAGRADEQVEAEYDGPEIPLHLNARYLHAALEATGGETVHIGLATADANPRRHVTLMITTPEDPNYQHVLTLIRRTVATPRRAAA